MGTGFFVTAPHLLPQAFGNGCLYTCRFIVIASSPGSKAMELSHCEFKRNDGILNTISQMSWLSKLLGTGTKGIGDLAKDIREAIKGKELDPNKQLETAERLVELQAKINETEAGHRTIFVAGWRPFIGWVIGVALLYNFILRDLIIFAHPEWSDLPALQMDELFTILFGMLGLGGMRTWEKKQGVTK